MQEILRLILTEPQQLAVSSHYSVVSITSFTFVDISKNLSLYISVCEILNCKNVKNASPQSFFDVCEISATNSKTVINVNGILNELKCTLMQI